MDNWEIREESLDSAVTLSVEKKKNPYKISPQIPGTKLVVMGIWIT